MDQSTITFIYETLQNRRDQYLGNILHLRHQLGLPPEQRVIEISDDEMQAALDHLEPLETQACDALKYFADEYPTAKGI